MIFSHGQGRPVAPLLFILPGLLGFGLFYLWPFVVSVGYSFLSRPHGGQFVGLANYVALLQNPAYLLGLRNTLFFMGVSVPLNMGLALGIALLLRPLGEGVKQLLVLIFLIPLVIPSGSMVFFWQQLFAQQGILNGWLDQLGHTPINWLGSNHARGVVITIFVWKSLGFNMVLFLAGLANIPKAYHEAAGVDGAGKWYIFTRITLPCLLPTVVIVSLMSIVNSFKVFRELYLLMGSHPHPSVYMLQHFMNNNFFSLNYPRLTTATTLLSLAIGLIAMGLFRLERRFSHD